MTERWLPLALVAVWSGLVRCRIRIQRQRLGTSPVHFGRDQGSMQRLRDGLATMGFGLLCVLAVGVGLGYVELASHSAQRTAGIVIGFGGGILMFSAQRGLGESWRIGIDPEARTPLVTHGWYTFCRNPIYLCIFVGYLGFALLVPNVVTWCMAGGLSLGLRAQTLSEERWLAATYGVAWSEYAARVGRFVPLVGRIRS